MGKILRLSVNNIKKHKLEAVSMMVLIMFCMVLLGSSISSFPSIKTIFPDLVEKTGSYENYLMFTDRGYDPEFKDMVAADERVSAAESVEIIGDLGTRYIDKNGDKQALYMYFITEDNEAKLEHSAIDTTLSDDETAALEHPVYMPYAAEASLGLKEGDTFDVICGTRHFPFTVAGFYETLIYDNTSEGLKMIINDSDYHILSGVIDRYHFVLFNTANKDDGMNVYEAFKNKAEEEKNIDTASVIYGIDFYNYMEIGITQPVQLLLLLMMVMAVIIIICVSFMIMFRINTEIRQQMVSIGVLEAIGYTSKQIALSYALEYVMVAAVGIILGSLESCVFAPAILNIGGLMCGHQVEYRFALGPIITAAAVLFLFVAAIAYIRSSAVKKYPPVVALRSGMEDHHFGKEILPLRKTKGNVHIRLAMKNFASHLSQSIGLAVCMTLAVTTVLSSFVMYDVLGRDAGFIRSAAGIELSDVKMTVTDNTDAEALAGQLRQNENVRKILLGNGWNMLVTLPEHNIIVAPIVYKDYSDTENINVINGRFPENDNEIMITKICEKELGIKTGDSLLVSMGSCSQSYIVCGEVVSITDGGANFYLTEEGIKKLNPLYKPRDLEIYLKDGTDKEEFREYLTSVYGKSLADTQEDTEASGSLEDKIKAAADKRIAELMSVYGVTHVEYAVTVGDTVISGNNDNFCIKTFLNINDILDTQLANITKSVSVTTIMFTVIASVVVMIILFILMSSTVRKQRKELGIMKGMGYTSRELMLQLAFRIVPASIAAVFAGSVLTLIITNFLSDYVGKMIVSIPKIAVMDILILLFCFGCAYIGARKIKKISVYELMSE